ncbi:hypothetical protein [Flavobacterium undicola]|uniref:hypothetical protein n=1 Tax=Flavobacterium undicola TaxID=1932779 RepID=UPI001377CE8D|nr:hypothetical protein [Flavobacterium undicola]MBA0882828.1 hypothetical protein [Flavobacterium undicola]
MTFFESGEKLSDFEIRHTIYELSKNSDLNLLVELNRKHNDYCQDILIKQSKVKIDILNDIETTFDRIPDEYKAHSLLLFDFHLQSNKLTKFEYSVTIRTLEQKDYEYVLFKTNNIHEIFHKIFLNLISEEKEPEPFDLLDTSTVKKNTIIIKEKYGEMFSNNGFDLFEHILNEFVKQKNTTGRYEDLSYYYRCLFEDKFIHQKPAPFRLWFIKEYEEDFSKIKTKTQTTNSQRKKDYSTALEWFKLQNK